VLPDPSPETELGPLDGLRRLTNKQPTHMSDVACRIKVPALNAAEFISQLGNTIVGS